MDKIHECLKIENQLCFPLYAASKELIKSYKTFLAPLDLTYTQYITMMLIWEHKELTSKEIGNRLLLDSGTLTPVLKKLEAKKYITRNRQSEDERNLLVKITEEGENLQELAKVIPVEMVKSSALTDEEIATLYRLLYKLFTK